MKTIVTRNSTYEVDEENKRVRRVTGTGEPCRYIGEDGEWRDYAVMTPALDGLVFSDGGDRAFMTSTVLSITED